MQLFVNDLTVMDFSYLCPKRGMVGESWIVDVILQGSLNEESMVLDFGKVKKQLKYLIDEYVDHKLLIPAEHSFTKIHRNLSDGNVAVDFLRPEQGSIHLHCPPEAYAFVYSDEVNMQSVSDYLRQIIATHLPENVDGITLKLREEVINTPYYHYTHGLKKHDGNCQRIAHGHRSKVTVFENGVESINWQTYWAERWCDIYIGTKEDIISAEQYPWIGEQGALVVDETHVCFTYEASQGEFSMAISRKECEVIDTDSTVECLAQYMLSEQEKIKPEGKYQVMAFEGVGKGAIVESA